MLKFIISSLIQGKILLFFFIVSDLPQRNNQSKTHKDFTEYKCIFFYFSFSNKKIIQKEVTPPISSYVVISTDSYESIIQNFTKIDLQHPYAV